MATRSGKTAAGQRDRRPDPSKSGSRTARSSGTQGKSPNCRDLQAEDTARMGSSPGPGPTFAELAIGQVIEHDERQDGTAGASVRRTGPRRILIFARTLKEASDIAKRKKYPRDLWRFVTGAADTDVDPREWATITVVGFGKGRPLAKDAYDLFQARCRGFGIKAPSYDP